MTMLPRWTYTETLYASTEAEARTLAESRARAHVPDATFGILSVKVTPRGRYSMKIERQRLAGIECEACREGLGCEGEDAAGYACPTFAIASLPQ